MRRSVLGIQFGRLLKRLERYCQAALFCVGSGEVVARPGIPRKGLDTLLESFHLLLQLEKPPEELLRFLAFFHALQICVHFDQLQVRVGFPGGSFSGPLKRRRRRLEAVGAHVRHAQPIVILPRRRLQGDGPIQGSYRRCEVVLTEVSPAEVIVGLRRGGIVLHGSFQCSDSLLVFPQTCDVYHAQEQAQGQGARLLPQSLRQERSDLFVAPLGEHRLARLEVLLGAPIGRRDLGERIRGNGRQFRVRYRRPGQRCG